MSTKAGSSAPLPNNQEPRKTTSSHPIQSPPPPGDGKTLLTPTWSPDLHLHSSTHQTYIIDRQGQYPRYVRTTLPDARSWAQTYNIFDGRTYQPVFHLPAGPMANPAMPLSGAEARQIVEIEEAERVLVGDRGEAGMAYNALQGLYGDAFEEGSVDGGSKGDSSVGQKSSRGESFRGDEDSLDR